MKRYLPAAGLRIIEGGCGCGHFVDSLTYWGYQVVGVDYAQQTITRVKEVRPDLDVRLGDVRRLEFEDGFFDGYLSMGVIEHFWEGYEDIIKEMHRVLKPGGYAFVAFPSISRLDRLKITTGGYRRMAAQGKPRDFYQFALNAKSVSRDIEELGFRIVRRRYSSGLLGLERIFGPVRRFNAWANRIAAGSKAMKYLLFGLSFSLAPLSGHMTLIVCRKT
jgi:SAM-dependent methyltransferase